jgi:hypothetical protein
MFRNLLKRTAPGLETEMVETAMGPEATWAQVIFGCNRIAASSPLQTPYALSRLQLHLAIDYSTSLDL